MLLEQFFLNLHCKVLIKSFMKELQDRIWKHVVKFLSVQNIKMTFAVNHVIIESKLIASHFTLRITVKDTNTPIQQRRTI